MSNSEVYRSEENPQKRKLLTILAADVAEFSRIVAEDEQSALDQLRKLRDQMFEIISRHDGVVSNSAGDSVIACFQSPLDAVMAALATQSAHKESVANVPSSTRLRYRIGINIGDVELEKNGDVLGHGVNVAARLEQLAAPGGICMSQNVFEHVTGRLQIGLTKLGEHYVKNLHEPITVYSVSGQRIHITDRLARNIRRFSRSPLAYLALLSIAGLALILSVSQKSRGPELFSPDLQLLPRLSTDLSANDLLSNFDLVTEGRFNGSTYYIIRTGGLQLGELERIAEILGGEIVSIGSQEENDYLFELSISEPGHWVDDDGQASGPMIGLIQDIGANEPDGGWRWTSGEPLDFVHWNSKGPDNFNNNQNRAQFRNHLGLTPVPYWDDINEFKTSVIFEVVDAGP